MKINRPVKWLSQALALSTLGVRRGGGRSAGLRLRGSRNLGLHALLTVLLLALGGLMVPVAASAAPGDVGVEGPSHTGTGTPTGSKRATSGLWFNDGALVGEPVGHFQRGLSYLPVQCRDELVGRYGRGNGHAGQHSS